MVAGIWVNLSHTKLLMLTQVTHVNSSDWVFFSFFPISLNPLKKRGYSSEIAFKN